MQHLDTITHHVTDFDGEIYGLIYQALAKTCDSIVERDQTDNPHNSQQVSEIIMKLYQCNSVAEAIMRTNPDITQAFSEIRGGPNEFQHSVDFQRENLPPHHRTNLTDSEYNLAWTLSHHLDHDWIMNGPLPRPPDLRWSSSELGTILEQCVKCYFEHDDDGTGADPVFHFLSTVASSTKNHLTTVFKTYLDEIARGSDPVQALTEAPFWQEGGAFREVATQEPNASTGGAEHGFDHLTLHEQLDIIKGAYDVPADEYGRWLTIISNVERLEKWV